jgi:hypothetical protein
MACQFGFRASRTKKCWKSLELTVLPRPMHLRGIRCLYLSRTSSQLSHNPSKHLRLQQHLGSVASVTLVTTQFTYIIVTNAPIQDAGFVNLMIPRVRLSLQREGAKRVYHTTFKCNVCHKGFTRAYNLRNHLQTHMDVRPFLCSFCGKGFARQGDQKMHEGLHRRYGDVAGPQAAEAMFAKGMLQPGCF